MDFQIPDKRQYIVFWLDVEQTLAIAGEEDTRNMSVVMGTYDQTTIHLRLISNSVWCRRKVEGQS